MYASLITVAAGPVLDLAMPPSLLFLFGLTGLLASATAALAMRQTVLRMANLVIDAEAAPRALPLHAMTDRLPEGIALWDKDDRLVLCNQAYREFFSRVNGILRAGVHFDDALNAELDTAYIPAAAAPSWFEQRQQRHWIGDFSERRKIGGREYGVLDKLCAGGGTLTLVNDVTAVKTKERESRDAQECYALVPLSSNEGLWAMDLRIDHFYISPRVLSIISSLSDPASFRQEDWVAAIHPDDVHKYQVGWQEDLDGVSRIFDLEYSVLHGNGEQRWISDRALVWRGLGPVHA